SRMQEARLASAGAAPDDAFGEDVAIAGDLAFIGAPGQAEGAGAVHQYRYAAGEWSAAGELTVDGLPEDAAFGAALVLREDELLVGSPGPRNGGVGAVFSFRLDADAGDWQLASRLLPFGATERDGFGIALAYGDELLVGSPGTNGGLGVAFAFGRSGDGLWERASRLLMVDAPRGANLGSSVATDGDVAAFGMIGADYRAGRVAIFERDASTRAWRLTSEVMSAAEAIPSITGGEVRCEGGKATRFDCADVDLLSFLSIQDIGGERGARMNDVWGWTDAETGREYVIAGRVDGTSFVDITDPVNPVYLGSLRRTDGSPGTSWRDIKIYDNHAFIVSDGAGEHGVQVFDLTRLRGVQAGAPAEFDVDAHYTRVNSAHNIVINEESGFAYSVGGSSGGETCGGGLHIIDVRDPKNPTFAGCFSDPQTGRAGTGYTHDAQCVNYRGPDSRFSGREICFNANETALSIADVTDKSAPVALSRAAYPNVGYTHQGWLDDEQRYFYMNDELDELQGSVSNTRTLIWDVSDLEDPRLVGEFLGATPASDHNLYVRGDLMYQSNYMAGLRIIDIRDRENPREVASFDTAPFNAPQAGFAGSWSNYPFFQSGVIAVTSMGEGLFLVKKRDTRPVSN
ncbi:MAG: choice-of-anchor B family protein, partial [Longimicrobiales bacterium]